MFSGGVIDHGGSLSGPGVIHGKTVDSGMVSGASINVNGILDVVSGGATVGDIVHATGVVDIESGATASGVKVVSGGTTLDDGSLTYTAAATLAGALSGSGRLVDSAGLLVLSGDQSAFDGRLIISGGTVELASSNGIGGGNVTFGTGSAGETLRLEAADTPASGGAFATTLFDLDAANEHLDLAGVAFTSGATATLSGHTLTLRDGTYTASFNLAGTLAASYIAVSDGAAGTLIRATAAQTPAALVQATASFAPASAAASRPADAAHAATSELLAHRSMATPGHGAVS